VGPFLSIEQAALSHVVSDRARTEVFAWYTLTGSFATALGALVGGTLSQSLQKTVLSQVNGYRAVVVLYGVLGIVLALLFMRVSRNAEVSPSEPNASGGLDDYSAFTSRAEWWQNSPHCSPWMPSPADLWCKVSRLIGFTCDSA